MNQATLESAGTMPFLEPSARSGPTLERLRKDEGGAAYVEFLITFPIMLTFFLALLQLSLLFVAKLSVQHAATRAARAAVVVLPDNPNQYDGEAVNLFKTNGASSSSSIFSGFGGLGLLLTAGHSDDGSQRLNAIRTAAYMPMLPLAPSALWLTDTRAQNVTVDRAFEAGAGRLTGILYAQSATAVTFYKHPGDPATDMVWPDRSHPFGAHEKITTRVTYLYYCSMPLVKQWMCANGPGLAIGALFGSRDALRELRYSGSPAMVLGFIAGGALFGNGPDAQARFVPLRAEATLPNQGASYEYH